MVPALSPRDPSPTAERSDLAAAFRRVRARTEALCAPLSAEDLVVQSMPDASPGKWHLAHTTWFFEEFLLRAHEPRFAPFHPRYGYLFNSYYDAVGPRHARPQRGLLTRPALEEVRAYRAQVEERVERLLRADPPREAWSVLELGLHHEQQHQELVLTDVKHALFANPLRPAYAPQPPERAAAVSALDFAEHAGGLYEIGHAGPGFTFDNEGPRHRCWLEPFALASRGVTCGEYLEFVEDGGYARPELWLSDGHAAAQAGGWQAPLYWERDGARWTVFTLHGQCPLDPGEPLAHVSFYEADAYARWAGARLPTEQEWEVGAAGRALPGEAWEWTRSAYAPYPSYRPAAGALGEYNGKFMSGQQVLRGGSRATPAGHVRITYRNFFPPAARWQFSGLRLAREP
jgi:ergothioneine biosynthesis protein EgtB